MSLRETLDIPGVNDAFVLSCLSEGLRVDGRGLLARRSLSVKFRRGADAAGAELHLGDTRVSAVVAGELTQPFPDRPNEGFLTFAVEFSALGAPGFEAGRPPPEALEICRYIERSIRESNAIDLEALAVVQGERVWSLRCDVVVLDHGGNLRDACSVAAMAALQHYRQPAVDVDDASRRVTVKHPDQEEPSPLPLHHIPYSVTFALIRAEDGEVAYVYDPELAEEHVAQGTLTFSLNKHREVCTLHFPGGLAVTKETLLEAADVAATKATELHDAVQRGLELADEDFKARQLERLRKSAPDQIGAEAPLEGLAQGAEALSHLGYDDLHVTGTLRKEAEKTPEEDAGMAALLQSLERAADLTEARANAPPAPANGSSKPKPKPKPKSIPEPKSKPKPKPKPKPKARIEDDSEDEEETMQLDSTL